MIDTTLKDKKYLFYYKELNGDSVDEIDNSLTLHREDGPALIIFTHYVQSGKYFYQITREKWFLNGKEHRDNGPAVIGYEDAKIKEEIYFLDGLLHREKAPAVLTYYENGQIHSEQWYQHGKTHREDGPAFLKYTYQGLMYSFCYYKKGKKHREDGPAQGFLKSYHNAKKEDNEPLNTSWFIDGEEIFIK